MKKHTIELTEPQLVGLVKMLSRALDHMHIVTDAQLEALLIIETAGYKAVKEQETVQ